jgi:hypothetical protein
LEVISSDLLISTPSSRHESIEAEGSRELELAKNLREVILGSKGFLSSIQARFLCDGIKTSG